MHQAHSLAGAHHIVVASCLCGEVASTAWWPGEQRGNVSLVKQFAAPLCLKGRRCPRSSEHLKGLKFLRLKRNLSFSFGRRAFTSIQLPCQYKP